MVERIKNEEPSPVKKSLLILLGAWIFAFHLVPLFNEIGIVLVHVFMGRSSSIIYLHLFEWSHTDFLYPLSEPIWWLIGNFINIIIATVIFLILRTKRNQYFLPFLMWAPTAYILQGYGILTSLGVLGGPWTTFIDSGFPIVLALVIGILFWLIGIFLLYLIFPLACDVPKTKMWKLLGMNVIVFPFWTIIQLFYSGVSLPSIVGVLTATIVAIVISLVEKPLFPIMNRITRTQKIIGDRTQFKELKWSAVGLSCGLAMILMLIFIFTPFEPYTEKGYVANLVTFIIIIAISFIVLILILYQSIKRRRKSSNIKTKD